MFSLYFCITYDDVACHLTFLELLVLSLQLGKNDGI